MLRAEPDPGFVAISGQPAGGPDPGGPDLLTDVVCRALIATGLRADPVRHGSVRTATWGGAAGELSDGGLSAGTALPLALERRHRDRPVSAEEVRRGLLAADPDLLAGMLPPFAAATLTGTGTGVDTVLACVDGLGMRQLYCRQAPGWAAVSTSARLLAALAPGCEPDLTAVAVQSQLGWQLGHRTLFLGVEQVPAGSVVTLRDGRVATTSFQAPEPGGPDGPAELAATVDRTRDLLRDYLTAYLADHPDPVLQLTGGQDSRLLLSAIDPARRRGLRVMTLGVPGSPDTAIAAALAERYGMRHEVLDLGGLEGLDPEEAWARCVAAARRLELAADPVARAALDTAEERALPGPRISGLGGEVARGFYYLGVRGEGPVTERRARRLAAWRLVANDAVAAAALEPAFAQWAREVALTQTHLALAASGDTWFAATDRLYLEHRMQRWAGATETAVCSRTAVANPMLDDRFLAAVRALAPADKRGSRFLARLQVALDPELADLPLDGRPPPRSYAEPGWAALASRSRVGAAQGGRKVLQRAAGGRRAPAGGPLLARRATAYLRGRGDLVEPVAATGVFRSAWLDAVVSGAVEPDPATAALLVNLVATGAPARPGEPAGSSPI
ncbi:asparagine synthetase B family protein [Nocardioides pantholopis]|uniref:asparagine synthase-related protein n=1 Tax=Nocardioides pantholopis TaxID=2483798 RepID=UPI000F08C276|nr:asparagine synthase-related protein [Nocardioides pantholopis]